MSNYKCMGSPDLSTRDSSINCNNNDVINFYYVTYKYDTYKCTETYCEICNHHLLLTANTERNFITLLEITEEQFIKINNKLGVLI